jgi:hypothetical protein
MRGGSFVPRNSSRSSILELGGLGRAALTGPYQTGEVFLPGPGLKQAIKYMAQRLHLLDAAGDAGFLNEGGEHGQGNGRRRHHEDFQYPMHQDIEAFPDQFRVAADREIGQPPQQPRKGADDAYAGENAQARDIEGELGGALPNFIYWLLAKVGLIEIATDNDSYAYAIFETMNDRGKPLRPVDMLKAYLLAPVENPDQRRAANHIWKQQVLGLISWSGESEQERDANCIKAWFRAQHADTIRERHAGATDKDWELIGTTFHRWVRDNHARLKLGTEAENLKLIHDEFPFFAAAYKLILDASRTYTPGLEAVCYVANNEFTWQNTVLLAPLCASDDTETVRRKIRVTATYLDIWLIRRVVNYIRIGYSSTSYAMFKLCTEVRRKSLEELVTILSQKLALDDVTFEGNKTRQRYGLDDLGLNQFSRRYIAHMLARITAYVEAQSGQPDLFPNYVDRQANNACDIEHIWPNDFQRFQSEFADQAEFQRFRNHIASLLLLPADVNRSLQDKPYEEKAPHYGNQNLFAASLAPTTYQHRPQFKAFKDRRGLAFKPYDHFGKAEQLERRQLMEQLANLIWSPERLNAVAI